MLGKLESVDLRSIWKNEAHDFTNWLAKKENVDALAEELGLNELEVQGTEVSVGAFAVDIVAEETGTGKKVVIENQLETTDHDHLGKIITYASGLEASVVIWVFKEIRDEHRRAIDWLNEISNGDASFFAIQMELWRIGSSEPAPKFNVICSPNAWAQAVQSSQTGGQLSASNAFQLEYWKGLSEYLAAENSTLRPRKPLPQHWYNVAIGTSQAILALIVSVKDKFVRCDLYIPNNKELYFRLIEKREEIESKLGFAMYWQELPNAKASRVTVQKDMRDIQDPAQIQEAYRWYKEKGEAMKRVFPDYI